MFNQQPICISWSWQLKSAPEELWPYLTDTNRLFKDLKQPSVQRAHLTQSVYQDLIQLSYNAINRYEVWEEEPYEWEYPFRFGLVRNYQSGPYKSLKIQVDLDPLASGTALQVKIQAKPRLNILSVLATANLKTLLRQRIKKTIQQYDRLALKGCKPYSQSKKKRLVRGGEKRLRQIHEKLHSSQVDAQILDRLIDFIRKADDPDLQRIQPYELADAWGIPRESVLKLCLHAANADLLNFNWDLHCPKCRSIQQSVKTLTQIHEPIYCDHCEQPFEVNFNRTIQLSFTPHPLIRKVSRKQYCLRGPQTKSHILIQQYLRPGESRFLKTNLPTGAYTLRASGSKGTATIHVCKEGADTVQIDLRAAGLRGETVKIAEDPNLSFKNTSSQTQLMTLEKQAWSTRRVSAAQATSSQLFRDLFSNEVLRRGEKISVDNLTFMFTDLFDSTGMYNKEGDNKAVGQVINHFEILQQAITDENGALVKTIGDSVMAVFCSPDQALRAYLRAQNMLSQDERFTDKFHLKAGIHSGSCVAVNLNSRIDYFGSTVNIASRFVDDASENEVILSEDAFAKGDLKQLLEEFGHGNSITSASIRLKGFNKEQFRIKRIKVDNSPLRLVI